VGDDAAVNDPQRDRAVMTGVARRGDQSLRAARVEVAANFFDNNVKGHFQRLIPTSPKTNFFML
jgi:hypothetical protein